MTIGHLFISANGMLCANSPTGEALPSLDLTKPRPPVFADAGASVHETLLRLVSNNELRVTEITDVECLVDELDENRYEDDGA